VRPDGFHEVRTVLHTIDLSDRLTCAERPGPLGLSCRTPGVPVDRSNLVWRAADMLWRAAGRSGEARDVVMTLVKRVPVQAGLGGGSSDAAAALVALNLLWKLKLSHRDLVGLAGPLGADVPFFLTGGAALGAGRGEEIYPLPDLPRWWALVVLPPFGISTAEAYDWRDLDEREIPPPPLVDRRVARTWLGRLPVLQNDLEAPVARRYPQVGEMIGRLGESGALLAAMSGSGSAVYGLYGTEAAAKAARRRLRAGAGWATRIARILPRRAYERRVRPRPA